MIKELEKELKLRLVYPYIWKTRQNNFLDNQTNFIYDISSFDILIELTQQRFGNRGNYEDMFNYTLNRWYNYWSAIGVEYIFCSMAGVKASSNPRNRLVDFSIRNINFDHKTSVYPRGFQRLLSDAQKDPAALIHWLYANQSQEKRKHYHNRLFIILHKHNGQHWQLKAELSWLQGIIETYVTTFNPDNLYRLQLSPELVTLADIIWGIQ